jgi:TRAP-type C4-dicarboxylate transport system permease small subunit
MRALFSFSDTLSRYCAYMAAVLIFSIAGLILSEIVARTLFNVSFSFAWEYASYCMATAVFLGAPYTLRTGGHVRVSLLSATVPPGVAKAIEYLATAFALGITLFLAYALVVFAWQSGVTGRTSPTIDETPLVIPQGVMAFGASLLALQMAVRLLRLIVGEPPEDEAVRADYGVE